MTHCVVPGTLYVASLSRFTKFCDNFSIPESDHMPASEFILSSFVTTRGAGSVGKSAIKSWLLGVELWHRINGAPWHGGAELARCVEGAVKLAPVSSHRAKCDPVTIEHICSLHRNLDLTNSFDIAMFAITCIAFWCCCRYIYSCSFVLC